MAVVGAVAVAAGAAAFVYYTGFAESPLFPRLRRRKDGSESGGSDSDRVHGSGGGSGGRREGWRKRRRSVGLRGPDRPPATLAETAAMLAAAVRFLFVETLGKWPLTDLLFGVAFLLRRRKVRCSGRRVALGRIREGHGVKEGGRAGAKRDGVKPPRLVETGRARGEEGGGTGKEVMGKRGKKYYTLVPLPLPYHPTSTTTRSPLLRSHRPLRSSPRPPVPPLQRADVSRMYAREAVARLRGAWRAREVEMVAEYVALCYSFSRKPYRLFLEDSRLSPSDVLIYEPKAGLLKPAFAVIVDGRRRTVLVVVRGTHSTKDKLTCATGAVVPFHHTIMTDGGVRHIVLGYAHCGMVAAARAIAARCLPTLRQALARHPGFHVKVIGHSLGGATASLLTFILREKEGFASTTCVAFGPAAAMTWELAQSGECCVTSIVNGTDFIPTLCSSSLDDLRQEVTPCPAMASPPCTCSSITARRSLSRCSLSLALHACTCSMQKHSAAAGVQAGSAGEGARWWRQDVAEAIVVGDAKRGVESRHASDGRLPHTLAHALDMRAGSDGAAHMCAQGAADGEVVLVAAEPQVMVERGAGMGRDGGSAAGRDAEGAGNSDGHMEEANVLGGSGKWVKHSDDVEGLAVLLKAMEEGGEGEGADGEEDRDDSFRDAVGCEGEASFSGDSWRSHSGGLSWAVMEQQLQERLEASTRASKSEEEAAVSAAVVQDILREEEEVASQVAGDERDVLEPLVAGAVDSSGDVPEAMRTDPRRWFPCGRMVHLLRNEDPDEHREGSTGAGEEREGEEQRSSRDGDAHVVSDSVHEGSAGAGSAVGSAGGSGGAGGGPLKAGRQQGRKRGKWKAGMFETPRHVYSSIKLTGSMIQDHLMMNYRRTLLEVARELEQDDEEVMDEEYGDDEECTFNCG
ncbi:unnamed protein product [Closterium sp. Yama58-4]|nr:unnamed protein product [Closterium sp. Yama58-4]